MRWENIANQSYWNYIVWPPSSAPAMKTDTGLEGGNWAWKSFDLCSKVVNCFQMRMGNRPKLTIDTKNKHHTGFILKYVGVGNHPLVVLVTKKPLVGRGLSCYYYFQYKIWKNVLVYTKLERPLNLCPCYNTFMDRYLLWHKKGKSHYTEKTKHNK